MAIPFHSPTHIHVMYIDCVLETSPHARPTWAETIMLVYDSLHIEIDQLTHMCSQNNLIKFAKNYKNTSPMK
jgi:hypothetical protein